MAVFDPAGIDNEPSSSARIFIVTTGEDMMADQLPAETTDKINQAMAQLDGAQAHLREVVGPKPAASVPASDSLKPAVALMKFLQALIVFSTAIISALFIGLPNTYNIRQVVRAADGSYLLGPLQPIWGQHLVSAIYLHTLKWLIVSLVASTVVAFLVQVSQSWINKGGFETKNGPLCLMAILTFAAAVPGIVAAVPYMRTLFEIFH